MNRQTSSDAPESRPAMPPSSGPGLFTILFAMVVISAGAVFVRQFMAFSLDNPPPPPVDPLHGPSSAADHWQQIRSALEEGKQLLTTDRQRVLMLGVGAPTAGVFAMALTVVFGLKSRRATGRGKKMCVTASLLMMLTAFGMCGLGIAAHESDSLLPSRAVVRLFSNKHTTPPVVVPGDTVEIRFDPDPAIKAIQTKHELSEPTLHNVLAKGADGQEHSLMLKATAASGEPSHKWDSFATVLPELTIDPAIQVTIPNDPALHASILTADLKVNVDYPAWVQLDRFGVESEQVTAPIALWIADPEQAAFAAGVDEFKPWLGWLAGFAFFGALIALNCGVHALIPGKKADHETTNTMTVDNSEATNESAESRDG